MEEQETILVADGRRMLRDPVPQSHGKTRQDVHMAGSERQTIWCELYSLTSQTTTGRTEVDWLGVEGLKGLVWGGGWWFANNAGCSQAVPELLLKRQQHGLSAPQISNSKSVLKGGTFYATWPPRA